MGDIPQTSNYDPLATQTFLEAMLASTEITVLVNNARQNNDPSVNCLVDTYADGVVTFANTDYEFLGNITQLTSTEFFTTDSSLNLDSDTINMECQVYGINNVIWQTDGVIDNLTQSFVIALPTN